MAFNILADPTANIFQSFTPDMYKTVREGIIRCILATDMARHNEILNQFNQIASEFDYNNRAHVNLVSSARRGTTIVDRHLLCRAANSTPSSSGT